jgi:hypothetical protein
MKRKIVFAFVTAILLNVHSFAINDQSLKGENTFGLLEDNFDLFFYPEYLADYNGYELYTNLHNTSGANRFQIGWFGLPESVPGKLFFMFDTTRSKISGDVLLPAAGFTPGWPAFLDPVTFIATGEQGFFNRAETNFFDDNGDYKSDRSILRNAAGESWTETSQYEFLLGYGVPLNNQFNLGAAFLLLLDNGEARDSLSTFDISYIETDLNTGTVLENYSDKSEAKIRIGGSNLGFVLGGKYSPEKDTKIGLELAYQNLNNKGDGTYSSSNRNGTWTRGTQTMTMTEQFSGAVGDPLNGEMLPYKGSGFGAGLKTYFPIVKNHTLRFDARFNLVKSDVTDGNFRDISTSSMNDPVNTFWSGEQTSTNVNYSGKNGAGTVYSVLVADVVEVTNLLQFGFGLGFMQSNTKYDIKRNEAYNLVYREDYNGDNDALGDPLDYDPVNNINEYRYTEESSIEQNYNSETTLSIFRIPVSAVVRLSPRIDLRLGAEHYISTLKNTTSITLNSGSYQTKMTDEYGDGSRYVSYTAFTVPDDTKSSSVDVTSSTDYRIGLGIKASNNFFVDLLANYYNNSDTNTHIHELSQEAHEASSIWSIFVSGTLKFSGEK